MDKPTEAEIKKFWEWCGFSSFPSEGQRYVSYPSRSLHSRYRTRDVLEYVPVTKWTYPEGHSRTSLPPIDLNNLFKYAVPKLYRFGLLECSFNREIAMFGDTGKLLEEERVTYRWRLLLESQILTPIDGCGETSALALFWAIWEVIKES